MWRLVLFRHPMMTFKRGSWRLGLEQDTIRHKALYNIGLFCMKSAIQGMHETTDLYTREPHHVIYSFSTQYTNSWGCKLSSDHV
jgi:hypothetical protein